LLCSLAIADPRGDAQQFFPECDQVWCNLWTEGLAVYAAQQLNRDASDSQLLLMQPEPIG
jgi:hypothetical protein